MVSDGNTAVNVSYQLLARRIKSFEMVWSTQKYGFHLKKKTHKKPVKTQPLSVSLMLGLILVQWEQLHAVILVPDRRGVLSSLIREKYTYFC